MKLFSLAAIILCFSIFSFAQSDWKTKNFDTWTMQDVDAVLNKSEWIKSQEIRLNYEGTEQVSAGSYLPGVFSAGNSGTGTARTSSNTIKQGTVSPPLVFIFTMRLRSSLAVRLALIRKNQLETDTTKLTKEEIDLFNKKQRGLYDCPACAENYVVTLTSKSNENKNYDAVFTTFKNATFEELKSYIYLKNEKGEKREMTHFVAPKVAGEEAIFFFKRYDEKGNPLFAKDSKEISISFTNNEVNSVANFKLDIKPIIIGEKVDF